MWELQNLKRDDEYNTPNYAWENIKHLLPKDKIIWEAFYADGKSGDYLKELGFNVTQGKIDFFNDETLPEYDIIVSNPPYSICKKIMPRLLKLDKPFILLMPSCKINTSYFREYKDSGLQIIIPRKRIHFIKNGIQTTGCSFDCFYYCYKMNLKKDISWLE